MKGPKTHLSASLEGVITAEMSRSLRRRLDEGEEQRARRVVTCIEIGIEERRSLIDALSSLDPKLGTFLLDGLDVATRAARHLNCTAAPLTCLDPKLARVSRSLAREEPGTSIELKELLLDHLSVLSSDLRSRIRWSQAKSPSPANQLGAEIVAHMHSPNACPWLLGFYLGPTPLDTRQPQGLTLDAAIRVAMAGLRLGGYKERKLKDQDPAARTRTEGDYDFESIKKRTRKGAELVTPDGLRLRFRGAKLPVEVGWIDSEPQSGGRSRQK